jgi:hypothetical protein
VKASHGYYEIPYIEDPIQICLEGFKSLIDVAHVLAYAGVPVVGASLGNHGDPGVPLDRRIGHLEEEVEVAPAESGGELMNHIHVLPRHSRPVSRLI